jgi:SAM-dependent methyltransferase
VVRKVKLKTVEPVRLLKLDLGCGTRCAAGFEGVDSRDFGQAHKVDLRKPWPWPDNSVEAAQCSHFVEHLTAAERIHFVNELYRVLIPGGKCLVVTPHWASMRAYGDLTHQWPPVSEFWFYYLSKGWRESQAPHNDGYTCDFDVQAGYGLHPEIAVRAQERQEYAVKFYKEAAQDMIATFTKRVA